MFKYGWIVMLLAVSLATPSTASESVEQYCNRVIADQEKGSRQMIEAGLLYFHGMHMGKHCVTVDYVRAVELLLKAGDRADAQSVVNDLTDRANTGNPRAVSAIDKLERRGLIKKVRQ